jgi:hypothetical protein
MSFDDRSINATDEVIHENTPLIATTERQYRRIGTTIFIIFHIFLVVKKQMKFKLQKKTNLFSRLYSKC